MYYMGAPPGEYDGMICAAAMQVIAIITAAQDGSPSAAKRTINILVSYRMLKGLLLKVG